MGGFLGAPGDHELHCSVPRAKAFRDKLRDEVRRRLI
jgi:hypothetical protein